MGAFINFIENIYYKVKQNWKVYLMTAAACYILGTLLGLLLCCIFK
jgi:hypothetical protein